MKWYFHACVCIYVDTYSLHFNIERYLTTYLLDFINQAHLQQLQHILKFQASTTRPRANTVLTGGGYWGSRPPSPTGGDNASETSSVMPPPPSQQIQRPKSRAESKYDNLSYWRARKVSYYFIRYLIMWYFGIKN